MDAKQACDKLNGFNFQNRYLVGEYSFSDQAPCGPLDAHQFAYSMGPGLLILDS